MRQIIFCPLALSAWQIVLLIAGILAFLGIFWLILFGEVLYHILLVRTTKKKWLRGPSMDDPKYMKLYKLGEAWREEHLSCIRQVSAKSGKLNLAAEYYDFGSDRCVIILPGRMETAWYCAFFRGALQKGRLERTGDRPPRPRPLGRAPQHPRFPGVPGHHRLGEIPP